MLLAELIQGKSITLLDNLDDERSPVRQNGNGDKLHSPSLATVLTSTEYSDRLLSVSRKVTVKNSTTWILTGNNPQLSIELSRRCMLIRLEPQQERPWERRKFRHENILSWVRENRGKLLEEILTIIQSWIAASQPHVDGESLGSFESWSSTMRSLLTYLGLTDFLKNRNEMDYGGDPMREVWNSIVLRWFEIYRNKNVTAEQVLKIGNDEHSRENELFAPLLSQYPETSQKVELGRLLSRQNGRIFNGLRIVRIEDAKRGNRYALIPVQNNGGGLGGSWGDRSESLTGMEGEADMCGEIE